MNNNISLCVTAVIMTHFAAVYAPRAHGTRVQDFYNECCDGYSVCCTGDYVALKVMNTSR